jgi:hypothetical protein
MELSAISQTIDLILEMVGATGIEPVTPPV